ncbi:MAG: master DNA invertase Mpi family serine-type recombinase [Treponema sp.]|nr:master DNA invertase Mpi family serine-type recombinase [Treponema sp.]
MTYGYIRVSTDKQTVENQRFEIIKYARRRKLKIDYWIEETISGTIDPCKRNLGKLLNHVQSGDVIICSELSRLGRSMFMIMSILNRLMEMNVAVYTVKEGYRLGQDLQSKVLAFAFSISAEIERNLIVERTTEALKRRRAQGVILGRPKGRKNTKYKLSDKKEEILKFMDDGCTKAFLIEYYGISSATLYSFFKREGIKY